ncbi:hypothetical protein HanXRQr2_Chr13g0595181 [Helianthus annuus]|uniref:Uncharacterized protein n=1 Tax=Helianthus annuus TaxID=4232 RepID=A0A9K3HCH1_HELAN|nr:hypothetical protein HanXRQr2_Chr13g0595181 [Helianthus annuus]KAJ0849815.1 hypothetical protein HanPSC8_Chr13g0573291 [Helianthus annuus]
MAAYANVILGVVEDETDVDVVPTREELILLSSEESAGSSHDLIHHSSRAGPQQGPTQESAGEGVSTPPIVDPTVAAAEQKETRKKKREGKKTEGEKTAKEPANEPTRKRSSSSNLLDYVVVSDSLSGLNAGVKRSAPDPDDDITFTEMLAKKQRVLEDKKRELDAQAAVVLSEKKLKFTGEIVAPSESEVDLGFLARNLIIFLRRYSRHPSPLDDNCLSFTAASAKSTRSGVKVDISKITPPTSPPPVPFDVSPPYPDPKGKGKEGNVENDVAEKVVQSVAPGVVVQEGGVHVEGAETDWKSSEATPQGTIYTRRGPPSPGGGGPSGSRQGPEFRRVEGLTQCSRMDDLGNYREFYSLSLPPAERLFQKNRHCLDLLDDHIHSGVTFFSTTQEIVRDWQSMGEDVLEFEVAKKEFAAEGETFNSEKKGLLWRVDDSEEKLAKEKQFNTNC